MKYLGKYSGTVYDSKDDGITECCRRITEEQANDPEFIKETHLSDLKDCLICGCSCPRAKGIY